MRAPAMSAWAGAKSRPGPRPGRVLGLQRRRQAGARRRQLWHAGRAASPLRRRCRSGKPSGPPCVGTRLGRASAAGRPGRGPPAGAAAGAAQLPSSWACSSFQLQARQADAAGFEVKPRAGLGCRGREFEARLHLLQLALPLPAWWLDSPWPSATTRQAWLGGERRWCRAELPAMWANAGCNAFSVFSSASCGALQAQAASVFPAARACAGQVGTASLAVALQAPGVAVAPAPNLAWPLRQLGQLAVLQAELEAVGGAPLGAVLPIELAVQAHGGRLPCHRREGVEVGEAPVKVELPAGSSWPLGVGTPASGEDRPRPAASVRPRCGQGAGAEGLACVGLAGQSVA